MAHLSSLYNAYKHLLNECSSSSVQLSAVLQKIVFSRELLRAQSANKKRSGFDRLMAFQVLPHIGGLSHLQRTEPADNWPHMSLEVLPVRNRLLVELRLVPWLRFTLQQPCHERMPGNLATRTGMRCLSQ
jgi:hypothetical protein